MPAWLLTLLMRYGVPLAIEILRRSGFINWAEVLAIKAGMSVKETIESLETFSEPSDFPPQRGQNESDLKVELPQPDPEKPGQAEPIISTEKGIETEQAYPEQKGQVKPTRSFMRRS